MQTCLYDCHRQAGATIVDFHGWDMPIRYDQIPAEHQQVREMAGVFDLCHMGRLEITGVDALSWVDHVVTSDLSTLADGDAKYGLICDSHGQVVDDVIAYKLPDRVFLVVNASNRDTVIAWLDEHKEGRDATLSDRTAAIGMIAVQGPRAIEALAPVIESSEAPLDTLPYYKISTAQIAGETCLVATTGYTGEHGFEVYISTDATPALWERLLATSDLTTPIGLGARDTLRIEAGMPLYGNELSLEINPFEAGLRFAVKLDKPEPFVGRDALARIRESGTERKLVGFRIDSRKIARQGMPLFQEGRQIGIVTSGIPSPSLGVPIALALIERDVDNPSGIEVEIRGTRFGATPEPLPFASSTRKKSKRAL